jgi:hypothetical protein
VTHVPIPIDARIDVHVPRDVDYDVAMMPVKAAPRIAPGNTDRNARTKDEEAAPDNHSSRMIVVRPVCGPPPGAVNDHRIIYRYVYNLGNGGFDDDPLALRIDHDPLLAGGPQVSLGLGSLPELLHGLHYLGLLGKEGVSQHLHPLKSIVHHL